MMKKLAALVVAVLTMCIYGVYADEVNSFTVGSEQELAALANYNEINSVTLTKDLDMTGFKFETCVIKKLTGEFNGNGHTIKNLTLYGKANANTGLIAELTGSVAGLKLENINITEGISSNSIVGTVAGLIPGESTASVTDCIVTGSIKKSTSGSTHIGALVGKAGDAPQEEKKVSLVIKDCVTKVDVTCTDTSTTYVGGLLGIAWYWADIDIDNCAVLGDITGNYSYIGGIVGCINSGHCNLSLANTYLSGKLNGRYKYCIAYTYSNITVDCESFYYDTTKKVGYGSIEMLKKGSVSNTYAKTTDEIKALELEGFEVRTGEFDGYPLPVWKYGEEKSNKITLDGNKANVSIIDGGTYTVVFAAYSGEKLNCTAFVTKEFSAGENTADAPESFNTVNSDCVKAFLLRSVDSMLPVCEAAIYIQGE